MADAHDAHAYDAHAHDAHAPDAPAPDAGAAPHFRIAVLGSGFAGLGIAIALEGVGADYVVLERAGDVGGTWRDNSYPGCKCDVPSHLYSFSFAPNPNWSSTYSPQPEIWAYLRDCAERFGVVDHIRFGHEVRRAAWNEEKQRWHLDTAGGPVTADLFVLGNGALSEPAIPELPGLESFTGTVFHSARWDHEHDLAGERIAVIGTGASAIQFVPAIQPRVQTLALFQRTPPWVLPHTDRPIRPVERAIYRRLPAAQHLVRAAIYCARELLVLGMAKNPRLLRGIERLGRQHLRRQVDDPALRAKLTPRYSPGCKRLLLSNDYYQALNAGNVEVVTDRVVEVRPSSVVTADGTERFVDTIILGTGFRVTDNPIAHIVCGRGGRSLAESWATSGPQAYLGTTVAGFPNLFLMTGPNTGIGHTSLVVMIEAQIHYILDCLQVMDKRQLDSVELRPAVQADFNAGLQRKMRSTVWNTGGCSSWYLDAHGHNTTLWPDFTWRFRQRLRRFDADRYELVPRRASTGAAGPATPALAGARRAESR